MSRTDEATEAEIRANFEALLADYQPVTETGLDYRVMRALALCSAARGGPVEPAGSAPAAPGRSVAPLTPEAAEAAARALLEHQLNGTLAALDEAETEALLRAAIEASPTRG